MPPSRAGRRSPITAYWPAGPSSAGDALRSFITPTGTLTETQAPNLGSRSKNPDANGPVPGPRLPAHRCGRQRCPENARVNMLVASRGRKPPDAFKPHDASHASSKTCKPTQRRVPASLLVHDRNGRLAGIRALVRPGHVARRPRNPPGLAKAVSFVRLLSGLLDFNGRTATGARARSLVCRGGG